MQPTKIREFIADVGKERFNEGTYQAILTQTFHYWSIAGN